MNTGAANALQCAEDLALKSFVAARCARRQLEVDVGASSRVAELEEMVSALQKEKKDVEASLASVRIRAETSIKQLSEARERATAAEDAAKTAEEGRKSAEELVKAFRQVVSSEVVPLQSEVHSLLERFGIDAPVLAGEDANSVELIELFRWLRCCVAMTEYGSQFFGGAKCRCHGALPYSSCVLFAGSPGGC